MKRHEINKKRKDLITGRTFYSTILYPKIERRASDLYVESRVGDRLDLLANQFYSDSTLYWIIAIANPDKINMGSLFLTPGAQIRIPTNPVSVVDSYRILNR